MKILIAGSGGREHALAWRLAQTAGTTVYALPGNPGIANVAECLPLHDLTPQTILATAASISADLTVIGPEAPLVAGVVDLFHREGRLIFGPTANTARLEGSKVFAKNFFGQHGIPTAEFEAVDNYADALNALSRFRFPVVIKADGLAAGKGVVIAHDRKHAENAVQLLGPTLVIEEFLEGLEVSFIVVSDGRDVVPLLPCRDHKRLLDGDKGPNTGGMGAFCDPALLTPDETRQILDTIIRPTVDATGFAGFLYAGLIMTSRGPKLLEYNVRLGDPEAQSLLYHFNGNLPELLASASEGKLIDKPLQWRTGVSACIVVAAEGYPENPKAGASIRGIDEAQATGAIVFQAGTRLGWSGTVTAGGRVLGITATGPTRGEALAAAYGATEKIQFDGMHYRRDIGR